MVKSIISLIIWCSCATAALAATAVDLVVDAPDRYVVVRGDTLWSIAGRYLKDPWRWPELWRMNQAQLRNPHRIYPGDVLVLDRTAAEMRLSLQRRDTVRLSPQVLAAPLEAAPIPTIPTADIEPFLSKPLVIAGGELDNAPRIVRTQENRVALGAGNVAYVEGIAKEQGDYFYLYRPGPALVDPVTNELLGYQAIYLGDARVSRFGQISTVEIVKSPLEITAGDRLVASPRDVPVESYVPRAPSRPIDGRIIAAYNALYEVGPPSAIVALSKGARDGLEVGHVLAIYRNLNAATYALRESALYGRTGLFYDEKNPTRPYYNEPLRGRDGPIYGRVGPFGAQFKDDKSNLPSAVLPDERYGLLMVFRVFDRASYAIVLNADRPVNVLDVVSNP